MNNTNEPMYEEGGYCPECKKGELYYPPVKGCRCHINPPCSACVDNKLTCKFCGWEWDAPTEIYVQTEYLGLSVRETPAKRKIHVFEHGRITDFSSDGSSGSTMVWRGACEGVVSEQDIKSYFGNGSFGSRGPFISNGKFEYTLITD